MSGLGRGVVSRLRNTLTKAAPGAIAAFLIAASAFLALPTSASAQTVTLVLTPASVTEYGGVSTVTATVAPASGAAFTVTVGATAVSPAVAGDFTLSTNTTLSFNANVTTSTGVVTITGVDNSVDAPDKTVQVSGVSSGGLTNPVNQVLTIADDDAAPTGITLTLSDTNGDLASVSEDAGATTVTVTADVTGGTTYATAQTVTVTVGDSSSTPPDTAVEGTDYATVDESATAITIAIAAGASSGTATATFTLTPTDDSIDDDAESLSVSGSSDLSGVTVTKDTLTIDDNDAAPTGVTLTLSDTNGDLASVSEDAGATTVTVTADVTGGTTYATAQTVTVTVGDSSSTPPDTAVEGTDYATVDESATAITIAIAAGASSGTATATFTLTPTDDSIDDDSESLSVSGSSDLSGVTVTKDTLTIDDNDAAPTGVTLTLSDTNGDLASVSEDAGATTVTVTADVTGGTTYATAQTVTVTVGDSSSTPPDTAVEGTDYATVDESATAITIAIAAGASSGTATATFTLTPTDDSIDDDAESLSVSGSSDLSGVTVTKDTLTIDDNDAAPTGVTLTLSDTNGDLASVSEDAGATTVTVTADVTGGTTYATAQTVTVTVGDSSSTPPDTAVEGTDYATVDESATAITIAIAAGASSGTATATFTLTPTDDSIDDDAESLSVSGSSDLSGVTVTKDTLTIDDNDAAPTGVTLTLSDTNGDLASVSEDAGATTVTVTADVTGGTTYATAQTVTVTVGDSSSTPPDTAVEGTDYATVDESATAITIAIAAGASSGTATATFTLTPTDDSIDDDAESLSVSGSSDLSGVTVTKDTLTIDDNDAAPTGVTLTLSDTNGDLASVSEDAGATTVTVTADVTGGTTYATAQTVTVTVGDSSSTPPDTAVEGTDYATVDESATAITIAIAAGASSGTATATFTLTPTDDSIDDDAESLSVSGSSDLSGVTVTKDTLTIDDNDAAPTGVTLTLSDTNGDLASVSEDAGATTVTVTADVTGGTTYATAQTVTVTVGDSSSTPPDTAVEGTDYATVDESATAITIAIAAGASSGTATATFTLTPTDDMLDETDESLSVSGSSDLSGVTVTKDTLTITDNEAERTLAVSDATVDEGGTARFTVTLSGAVASDVTVDWTTEDGTAKTPDDYTHRSGTLEFAQNNTLFVQTVTVQTVRDAMAEGEETFVVRLSNVDSTVPVSLASNSPATGTIVDDVEAAAEARIDRVNEEIVPRVAQAMAASTLSAVTGRIEAVASGAPTAGAINLTDQSSIYRLLKANERSLEQGTFDLKALLDGRSFALPFHAAEDGNNGPGGLGGLAIWGSGDYTSLEGRPDSLVEWEGDIVTAHLGADTRLNEKVLAGMSVSWSRGSFDYTDRTSTAQGGGLTVVGSYESRMTGLHPYVSLSLTEDLGLWATLGYGWGEVEIDDNLLAPQSSDTEMKMAAVGASGKLISDDGLISGGTTTLKLKGEGALSRVELEGNGLQINPLTADIQRLRLSLEGSHAHELASGSLLTLALEVGVRHDGGDGVIGTGYELGGSVRFFEPSNGVTVEGRGRVLLAHEDEYEEWGVGGLVRVDPGASGHGLSLSMAPVFGDAASGTARLWDQGMTGTEAANDNVPQMRLDSEFGYGFSALGGRGLLTPYSGLSLVGDDGLRYRVGGRFEIGSALKLSLEGERRETANDADADHGVMLRMQARW